jgi:hypothetical protein
MYSSRASFVCTARCSRLSPTDSRRWFFAWLTTMNEPTATNGIAARKNAVRTRLSR